jgi:LDH2 family malate/lactate/ureidoglycolate dehydrogenase
MLGTNPVTFGFPTDEPFPFILDCSTSTVQTGKLEVYAREGKPLEEDWVIDADGNPLKDAANALEAVFSGGASLLPLGGQGETRGGHKGYGYATAVELLCTAFQQGPFMKMLIDRDEEGNDIPYALGHFFMALDIEAFCDLADFKKAAGDVMRSLRNSKKAGGQKRIYTAGEKEYEMEKIVGGNGIPVGKSLQEDLLALRAELGLDQYHFDF